MTSEVKRWRVEYAHPDGRNGSVMVTTEVQESDAFCYGNGKAGRLTEDGGGEMGFDLRYNRGDLHAVMIDAYFGDGLVMATEQ